ncbi:hypothetical protein TIFTF001_025280 [Ficus carica]|uniref:Uncharacterized protein n=1 Tax=Ficus carica TaxID=3494 RepID=A0AA88DKI9_FICCA|nr:hypothetical protein TIFTF001_025280 [Ficus carica]
MKVDCESLIESIRSCRNKVQVYRSVRMSQLHISLHFHLTTVGQKPHHYLGYATGGTGEVGIREHSSLEDCRFCLPLLMIREITQLKLHLQLVPRICKTGQNLSIGCNLFDHYKEVYLNGYRREHNMVVNDRQDSAAK